MNINLSDSLSVLNVLIVPVLVYVVNIERRLVKLEVISIMKEKDK